MTTSVILKTVLTGSQDPCMNTSVKMCIKYKDSEKIVSLGDRDVQGVHGINNILVCLTISSLNEYLTLLCFYVRTQVAKH